MNGEMRGRRLMKPLAMLLILSVAVFAASSMLRRAHAQTMTVFKVEPVNTSGGIGATVMIDVNVSDAIDLWGWQVFMTWNQTVLQYASLAFGDFLAGQPDGTTQMSYTDSAVTEGWLMASETTFGQYPGVGNETYPASGWLMSVNFTVLAEGGTTIGIDSEYTYWQDSTLAVYGDAPGEMIKDNGYYRTLAGDCDGDGDVDYADFIILAGAYGSSSGQPAYDPRADFDSDGDVDYADFIVLAGAYGTSL